MIGDADTVPGAAWPGQVGKDLRMHPDALAASGPPPVAALRARPGEEVLHVLLIEDDEDDAFLVQELLAEADARIALRAVPSLRAAREALDGIEVHCVLLDLGLPDASGLSGLRELRRIASHVAVCVLTGLDDEHLGIAALSEGAQDYLTKGKVDGVGLTRAVRYAVERKRADESARALREAELRQAESARLERGLLPQPLMRDAPAELELLYRPGRHRALLGGDFIDAVQVGPARVQLLVGDVAGHGVEAAALGVSLRVAWRALVLGEVPDAAILPSLQKVLESERRSEEQFATVAMVTVALDEGVAWVRLAGHPPPLVVAEGQVEPCDARPGAVLGAVDSTVYDATQLSLASGAWTLLIYTDGLIEGYAGEGERLGVEGLCDLLRSREADEIGPAELPGWLVERATSLNGGPLADDVAILLLHVGRSAHTRRGVAA